MFRTVRGIHRAILKRDPAYRFALWVRLTRWLLGSTLESRDSMEKRLFALAELGEAVAPPGYRYTWHQLGWWDDAAFNAYLDKFNERKGFNTHRRWTLSQLLRLVVAVPGDTAECGVFEGAGSYLMAASNRGLGLRNLHHGFDSFAGLSTPSINDGHYWRAGDLASPLEASRRNLVEFGDFVRLYPGWIPERFAEVNDRVFRFVHLDVDLYEPTKASLEFFYPRVSPGGIILGDDYLFTSCPGATQAFDEFLANKKEKMIGLPAGGGFLIKGVETGGNVR